MTHSRSLALALLIVSTSAVAQTPPRCDAHSAPVYEPGCDGPGRLTCSSGIALPAISTWCACDGRTVQSPSMAPPAGVRFRHEGACAVTAGFDASPERDAQGRLTGRVVVFVVVGSSITELARPQGPCRADAARPGELARWVCGARADVRLRLRREGDEVVGEVQERAVQRVSVPSGQRVMPSPRP